MTRDLIDNKYKWAVEDIFCDDNSWEKAYEEISNQINFSKYVGKLNDRARLLSFYKETDVVGIGFEKLALYANLKHDEDARVSKYTAYDGKIGMLYTKYLSETAFYEPELAALEESYLQSLVEDEDFKPYSYQIERIIKNKAHVLPVEEEKLLALASETFSTFHDTFGMINNVDLPLPEINFDGKTTRLTHGVYGILMHSQDRNQRKDAYEKYYASFISLLNTITSNYYGNVKKNVFLSKAYKFNNCLERALFHEDVNEVVYKNLLNAVESGFSAMHRYVLDRKKLLNVENLHFYDMYVSLVDGAEVKLQYDEAYEFVINGLAPLGENYQNLLRKARDERWIDVEETEGKRSGAYSAAVFGVHPYVLLNYQPTTSDIFTIAHELGHALHSYFTMQTQPYAKSNYTIFVAEVASTVNEMLLLKYMLAQAKDTNLKRYLLNYKLDAIRTTLFRQAMFAEFEYKTHTAVENGQPLTKEWMSQTYAELGKRYYGNDIVHDENIACEWCRIPHFYNAFYVYKYATGITAALNISNRILTEGQPAVDDYFNFLRSGCASDPVSLLKLAGVDLTSEKPFEFAMKEFADTLTEFEKLSGINE